MITGSATVALDPTINHVVVRLMIKRNVHNIVDAQDLLSHLNDRLIELAGGPPKLWASLAVWPPDDVAPASQPPADPQ